MSYEYKLTKTSMEYGRTPEDKPLETPPGEGWELDKMSTELVTFPRSPAHEGPAHHTVVIVLAWRRLKPSVRVGE